MRKLKIFLDTSVYSALYDKRDLNRQKQTQEFWNNIEDYDLYYSNINVEEIDAVVNEGLRSKLKALLKKGKDIEITTEVNRLAKIYIKEDLIPEKYENDAFNICSFTRYFN